MCVADKYEDSIHLPAKCTDCWMVQAVLSVGRQAARTPSSQEYSSISPTKIRIY